MWCQWGSSRDRARHWGKTMRNHFIGPGGCGMHFMRSLFEDEASCFTHTRRIDSVQKGDKVLYIFVDPYNAVLSYDRRGFLKQSHHVRNIEGDIEGFNQGSPWDLSKFLSNGTDFFLLYDHFNRWYMHHEREYEIAFVKYESLSTSMDSVCEFFGLPHKQFSYKARNSDWNNLDEQELAMLQSMYGDYHKVWSELPDFFIHKSS